METINSEPPLFPPAKLAQIDRGETCTGTSSQCLTEKRVMEQSDMDRFVSRQRDEELHFLTGFDENFYLSPAAEIENQAVVLEERASSLSEIWNSTEDFLRSIANFGLEKGLYALFETQAENSSFQTSIPTTSIEVPEQRLLLHALSLIQVLSVSSVPRQEKQIFPISNTLSTDINEQTSPATPSSSAGLNPLQKKKGRKPERIVCFLCPHVCGYKLALIRHLRVAHQIDRSQSVMYKRIDEGERRMRERFSIRNP